MIRMRKRIGKTLRERLGPRIQVRLEDNAYVPIPSCTAGLGDGRCDLRGVMRIVIKEPTTAVFPLKFETARSPAKRSERGSHETCFDTQAHTSNPRGHSIHNVVQARDAQINLDRFGVPNNVSRRDVSIGCRVFDDNVAGCAQFMAFLPFAPIGHGINTAFFRVTSKAGTPRVLATAHQCSALAKTPDEVNENLFEGLATSIAVQVIGFNVGDDLDPRRVVQERAIGFVGLGNENISTAQVSSRTKFRDDRPNRNRRISARLTQGH